MYKYLLFSVLIAFSGVFLSSCLTPSASYTKVAPGIWRGVLELEEFRIPVRDKDTVILLSDQFKPGELPFNFEVIYTDPDHFYIEIHNGKERIRCDSVTYGRDRTTARDTVNVYFPEYQSYIHADVRGGAMQGEWVVTTKDNYRIPFYAQCGKGHRFTPLKETPVKNISGNWAALFGIEKEGQEKAVAELVQDDNYLEGTFRTETGDYRYLEGTVQGRKFWMSCFDGAHAFLFSGSIAGDSLQGEFRSGNHYQTLWTAWKDPNFDLGNPDTLTSVKNGNGLAFEVVNPEGKTIKYPSAAFDGKIKIFTISGTWCPNCKDEQIFLRDYLAAHPDVAKDIAVVSFSFERHKELADANKQLVNYKKRLQLPYEVVYGGKADKTEAEKLFPALSHVMAFPTMMILDKSGNVKKVHTGFDGPATSRFEAFQKDFDATIQSLR